MFVNVRSQVIRHGQGHKAAREQSQADRQVCTWPVKCLRGSTSSQNWAQRNSEEATGRLTCLLGSAWI